ncbi:MAG: helix-turn-helix transcriptional regulator [Bacilli bacterium]|nr:helix-turn-helix transcriptional regulator [Bacilli bacterium]
MALKHSGNYYYDIIRKNIKKYRTEKGYTQKTLSELAEISNDYLAEIESLKRKKSFSIEVLARISEALDIDIKKFFEEND